jgi:hypothetical protein
MTQSVQAVIVLMSIVPIVLTLATYDLIVPVLPPFVATVLTLATDCLYCLTRLLLYNTSYCLLLHTALDWTSTYYSMIHPVFRK